jgi:ABC-2 type transport system ATP-binding protein
MDVISETKKIKQLVGYIPSDANAYSSMNALEFLNYSMRFYNIRDGLERIQELSALFELDLGRKIADLSLGNRKKVSIIQSLLHRPKLLILDEPTTGLDPLMQARFFELLRTENQRGMTLFFSSHVLSEVQLLCKRIAIIKEGKIVKIEDIGTLRKRQLRKVQIEFEDLSDKNNFQMSGMESTASSPDHTLSFMYSGNTNELIRKLTGVSISNLSIEEPSLEEIFMHYYQ